MSSFGPPPSGPDPNLTRPFPTVGGPSAPLPPLPPPPKPGKMPKAPRPARIGSSSTYGNIFAYLLARLAAFLIDVPGLAFVVTAFAYGQLHLDTRASALVGMSSFPFIAGSSLAGTLVFAMLCEGTIGTTIGKALFMLHVHRAGGGYAGFGRSIVRTLLRPIDLLLIGPALAAVTPRHQRLGDLAARTTVARSPIGPAAPVVAALLLGGIGYAEFAFGGGLDSAISVAAVTATYAPGWRDDAAGLLSAVIPGLRPTAPPGIAPAGTLTSAPLETAAASGSPSEAGPTGAAAAPSPIATAAGTLSTFPPGGEAPSAPAVSSTPLAPESSAAPAVPAAPATPNAPGQSASEAPAVPASPSASEPGTAQPA